MGLTFKENCADIRNSGIKHIIDQLKKLNCSLDLQDPWANEEDIKKIYNVNLQNKPKKNTYDAVLISVAHNEYKKMGLKKIKNFCRKRHVIFDLKNIFNTDQLDFKL